MRAWRGCAERRCADRFAAVRCDGANGCRTVSATATLMNWNKRKFFTGAKFGRRTYCATMLPQKERVCYAVHVDQNGNPVSFPDQTCISSGRTHPGPRIARPLK